MIKVLVTQINMKSKSIARLKPSQVIKTQLLIKEQK